MSAPRLLVFFDVDGTLIDSQHAIVSAMREAYLGHDLEPPDREAILSVVGLSVAEAVAELSREAPGHPRKAIGEAFKTIFRNSLTHGADHSPLYPGAAEVIDRLGARDDVLLALATGNSRRGVERFLDRFSYEGRFVSTQSADDAPSKPHPAMIFQACLEAGLKPEEAVMVGDTSFDMAMARAAGARAIGVSWGYHPADRLLAAGAELVLGSFEELDAALGLSDTADAI
ncbi:HAD-IA family hydrolase [Chenggangzhangella methanolivorans]|uniref:HAD-IA family hydrolase n=1 Tax=Chenggangzhangella methanolivorans TaxID=1437009 RepID=A0A9E6UMV8_9HYPH|nr:HAD-IA family hydrolase [Chenggangzhangella methanolivorans]QZO00406.1 HAD-IA family hydrolase [Chenggangzhangella methanolivorans]